MTRMIRKLVRHAPMWLGATLLAWIALSCVPILVGLVNREIFDSLQLGTDTTGLARLFVALFVLTLLRPVIAVIWIWLHHTVEPRIEALVRTNLVRWIVMESGKRCSRDSPVALLGHVRDDVPRFVGLVNEWYRIIGDFMFFVVALSIMLAIDVKITLTAFLPFAGIVLFTHWQRKRLPDIVGRARDSTIAVTNCIGDVFGGILNIKAFGAEDNACRRLDTLNAVRARAEVQNQASVAWIEAISDASVYAGKGFVLVVGVGAILDGRFTVGDFLLFATYLDWILDLPRRFGRLLSQQKVSQKSLERLEAAMGQGSMESLVENRPTIMSPSPRTGGNPELGEGEALERFEVRGLTYRYPSAGDRGKQSGVFDVSFALRRGTLTVITGTLGSGKSTLLELILGLREADSGRLIWNGMVVDSPGEFMVPPRVAYKPQMPRLFSASVRENICLGWDASSSQLDEALERACLKDDIEELQDGLETAVGARGVRLSGGQVQRVSFARMFVRGCELYVMDDLSSALDDETEQEVWKGIDAHRQVGDETILAVSHRLRTLRRADQILVMEDGRIVEQGSFAQLEARSQTVRDILNAYADVRSTSDG